MATERLTGPMSHEEAVDAVSLPEGIAGVETRPAVSPQQRLAAERKVLFDNLDTDNLMMGLGSIMVGAGWLAENPKYREEVKLTGTALRYGGTLINVIGAAHGAWDLVRVADNGLRTLGVNMRARIRRERAELVNLHPEGKDEQQTSNAVSAHAERWF